MLAGVALVLAGIALTRLQPRPAKEAPNSESNLARLQPELGHLSARLIADGAMADIAEVPAWQSNCLICIAAVAGWPGPALAPAAGRFATQISRNSLGVNGKLPGQRPAESLKAEKCPRPGLQPPR